LSPQDFYDELMNVTDGGKASPFQYIVQEDIDNGLFKQGQVITFGQLLEYISPEDIARLENSGIIKSNKQEK
jgi:hypothetical protein